MALKGQINFRGLTVAGAYTRINGVTLDFSKPQPTVRVNLQDFANEAAAVKTPDDVWVAADYDPANPEHKRQYEKAGSPDLSVLDADGNPWRPTVKVRQWLGRRKEDPIEERSLDLPYELAIQVLAAAFSGTPPDGKMDNVIAAQAYFALAQLPEFKESEPV